MMQRRFLGVEKNLSTLFWGEYYFQFTGGLPEKNVIHPNTQSYPPMTIFPIHPQTFFPTSLVPDIIV